MAPSTSRAVQDSELPLEVFLTGEETLEGDLFGGDLSTSETSGVLPMSVLSPGEDESCGDRCEDSRDSGLASCGSIWVEDPCDWRFTSDCKALTECSKPARRKLRGSASLRLS